MNQFSSLPDSCNSKKEYLNRELTKRNAFTVARFLKVLARNTRYQDSEILFTFLSNSEITFEQKLFKSIKGEFMKLMPKESSTIDEGNHPFLKMRNARMKPTLKQTDEIVNKAISSVSNQQKINTKIFLLALCLNDIKQQFTDIEFLNLVISATELILDYQNVLEFINFGLNFKGMARIYGFLISQEYLLERCSKAYLQLDKSEKALKKATKNPGSANQLSLSGNGTDISEMRKSCYEFSESATNEIIRFDKILINGIVDSTKIQISNMKSRLNKFEKIMSNLITQMENASFVDASLPF